MICGNTQAEIDRDTQTDAQEQAQYAAEQERWKLIFDSLLEGVEVRENFRFYSLADWMIDKYDEFADFVDSDFDFMAAFNSGKLSKEQSDLIKQEARILASIIVG
jgi:hypothetical protein